MNRRRLLCLFAVLYLSIGLSAQLISDVRTFFKDSLDATKSPTVASDSDSLAMINMQLQLEEAKLNAANLKMQLESLQMQHLSDDSDRKSVV